MSDAIDALIERVIEREGGFVNHPADRGGATNMGITQGTLAAWRGHPVTVDQVRMLSRDEAAAIYRANYFVKPGFDCVPDPQVQELLFDYAVNAGPAAAAAALQKAVGAGMDGVIGPKTRAAVAAQTNWEAIFYNIKATRAVQFIRILKDETQCVFAPGWANRVGAFEYRRAA
jgi:lysozyme family protein